MAKAVKKQALGRGLSALLKNSADDIQSIKDENADTNISVSEIVNFLNINLSSLFM